ncbi:MAG: UDP-N-acetylglucosamine--N-acetylmuramyl-(pentapeptide) pyrophosphoryl-undecaprenol N-acetylglucosamine transferase [Patescibacteria group bacterium]|jgi:UDP-N-acetylglucosamine--N-acetylmuramyl-(pentapeptide) pyrophosphoryl-undecaprenol N-acetylglucosamine transferase
MTKNKTVVLVGGGTGGHIVPTFELYKKIKQINPGLRIVVVGDGGDIEQNFYSSIPTYQKIMAGKMRRHITLRNIGELIKFIIGFWQSLILIWRERPGLVFSKGGYVSLPIIFSANLFRVPYFVHESDTKIGLANRIGSRCAKKVFVTYSPDIYGHDNKNNLVFSGPIVRSEIKSDIEVDRSYFGFPDKRPVIFITGGSLGAMPLNRNVLPALSKLLSSYNIIHQTGDHSVDWVMNHRNALPPELRSHYFVTDFLRIEGGRDRMLESIEAADLVIARAGVTTISELALRGKAMILVPWKYAASDHQYKNSKLLEVADAAVLIKDDDLSPELINRTVDNLFSDSRKRIKELGNNAKRFFPADGLDRVAGEIIKAME